MKSVLRELEADIYNMADTHASVSIRECDDVVRVTLTIGVDDRWTSDEVCLSEDVAAGVVDGEPGYVMCVRRMVNTKLDEMAKKLRGDGL